MTESRQGEKYFVRIFVNLFVKKQIMSAIIIKSDNQNTKILKELAKKLGADVMSINEELYEDVALGLLMDKAKTGETVSRDVILKKLDRK